MQRDRNTERQKKMRTQGQRDRKTFFTTHVSLKIFPE